MSDAFQFDPPQLVNVASRYEEPFRAALDETEAPTEFAMLPSELLVVSAVVKALGCGALVESGRAWGFSTEVLARFFREDVPIHSFELMRDEKARTVEDRLGSFGNVILNYGDSRLDLETYVQDLSTRRVAVLIDGPKGRTAVDLARRLAGRDKVVVCFLHDAFIGSRTRARIHRRFERVLYSDHCQFVHGFSHLDETYQARYGGGSEEVRWRPYRKGNRRQESYGPTVAVIDAREVSPVSVFDRTWQRLESSIRRVISDMK